MTRDELKTAFDFISDSLDDIYSDVAFLDVVQDTTHDFPAVRKKALHNIISVADFANFMLKRLDSKEILK